MISLDVQPGRLRPAFDAALRRVRDLRAVERLWDADSTAFGPIPKEVLDRLGWLEHPISMASVVDEAQQLVEEADEEGIDRWYVIGMGGASLASEMMDRLAFGGRPERRVTVVDGTCPDEWRAILDGMDARRSMLVLSMKAWAYEAFAAWTTFLAHAEKTLGRSEAVRRAVVLTDPDAWLVPYARRLGVRRLLLNDPFVGGRYAASTWVGLLPATVRGADGRTLLSRARDARERCRPAAEATAPFASALAAAMVASVTSGEPFVHLVPSPRLFGFADWLEQLMAESLGKDGSGVVPVTMPPLDATETVHGVRAPARWPGIRWALSLASDDADPLATADDREPAITLTMTDEHDVLAACFVAEVAVAVAGVALGVHPFDQPDVEATKRHLVHALHPREVVRVPGSDPRRDRDDAALDAAIVDVTNGIPSRAWCEREWARVPTGSYLALCLYLPRLPAVERAVHAWWSALRRVCPVPVTLGYGPRYLHSTGQAHKGGGPAPHVVIVTVEAATDVTVPAETPLGARRLTLELADADTRALLGARRSVARLHVTPSDPEAAFVEAHRTFSHETRS